MKIKIALYGGTDLSPELISFTRSLTKALLAYDDVVIICGGFDYFKEEKDGKAVEHTERKSVDRIVMETAKECFPDAAVLRERFETWIPPANNDRGDVVRFREGHVEMVYGSIQARRFNLVANADALITIAGEGNTKTVIELALAINKPVLPIAFTGGDSKDMWKEYKSGIISTLRITDYMQQKMDDTGPFTDMENSAREIGVFIKSAVRKKCLVLMPFKEADNHFYDEYVKKAIEESNYIDHRIDRDDAAGNIPALFQIGLEKSRAVVVDITGYNPNVMYELGHVHAKKIAPLIIQRMAVGQAYNDKDLPFYLRHEKIFRQRDDEAGYEKIRAEVKAFLKSHY